MTSKDLRPITLAIVCNLHIATGSLAGQQAGDPADSEVWNPEPAIVTAESATLPPSDAIVLLGETGLSMWQHLDGSDANWDFVDGVMTVAAGTLDIETRQSFADIQLHIEWRTPAKVEGNSQERGNSGVFLQKRYEVQVLDSYRNRTYANGQAASIYKQHIPLVNASRAPGEWQTYDIVFSAPEFGNDGSLLEPAYLTVLHNGVLVQNHAELLGPTVYIGEPAYEIHPVRQPLMLQDHGNPVSYRNIWVRDLSAE
jgi:hypothetical protein